MNLQGYACVTDSLRTREWLLPGTNVASKPGTMPSKQAGEAPEPRTSILVVEDDSPVLSLVQKVLNAVPGWNAAAAPDARIALRMVQRQNFDVLLVDVDLPGMSGVELVRHVRRMPSRCSIPAILMTANDSQPQVAVAVDQAEVVCVLRKPFDIDDLVEVVRDAACGALGADVSIRDRLTAGKRSGPLADPPRNPAWRPDLAA